MFENIKIFIPTKGRLFCQKTYEILTELGLHPILVVEPQEDIEATERNLPHLTLPLNNQGIVYVRNYILDYCRKHNVEFCVMIDDDVNYFGRTDFKEKKVIKDNSAFLTALKYFTELRMSGGMEYVQFAWAGKKPITFNKGFQVCHFLYIPTIPKDLYYDVPNKEDKDFSIALLMNGLETFNLVCCALSVPSIGTNKGGLSEMYANKEDNIGAINLLNKWGKDIIKIVEKKNGRIDANINWRYIKKIMGLSR